MIKIGIYCFISPIDHVYIGQSRNLNKRKSTYDRLSICVKAQRHLYNSFLKYGYLNHKYQILELCSEEQLNEKEIYWEQYYKNLGNTLLNIAPCGIYVSPSEETRLKMSLAQKGKLGKKHTEEAKEKIRQSKIGFKNPFYGKTHTDEEKIRMSQRNKGKILSREHCEKLSIFQRGDKSCKAKLTSQQVRIIAHALNFGCGQKELSLIFNIGPAAIHKISKGYRWSCVTGINAK